MRAVGEGGEAGPVLDADRLDRRGGEHLGGAVGEGGQPPGLDQPGEPAAKQVVPPGEPGRDIPGQGVGHRPAADRVGVELPALDPERVVLGRLGQLDLGADERGAGRVAVLFEEVGEGEARGILVGVLADGPVECVVLAGHHVPTGELGRGCSLYQPRG